MLSVITSFYNRYSIFIILILLVIIVCLLKCSPEPPKEIIKDVRVPITSVILPMPKKKVMSTKSTSPFINNSKVDVVLHDSTISKLDTVLEYTGNHEVRINDQPAYIPYSISSTGKIVDFKLGVDYRMVTKVRDTRLKAYLLGNYNLKSNISIGIGLATPKYLTTYTYNPIQKEHNIGLGIKLFTIY